jgi:hypothetical protein
MKYNATCTLQAVHIKTGKVIDVCQFDSSPLEIEASSQEDADEKWSRRCLIEAMCSGSDIARKEYKQGKWK